MAMIEVDQLARRFGADEAVQGVSFQVEEGEVFGFLGPNGAGKTTMINMLCTLLRPTGGRAVVNGFDVVRRHRLAGRCAAILFSPVHGVLQPRTLSEWMLADQVPARLQVQLHKYIWPASTRGV